jgi:hypothetical protein
MNSLAQALYSASKAAVEEFVDRLASSELKVDKKKALEIWNSAASDELKVVAEAKKAGASSSSAAAGAAKKAPAKKAAKKDTDAGSSAGKCQYAFIKGDHEGEHCGSKVSDESETGLYCKKHLSHEKKKDGESKKAGKKDSAAPKKGAAASKGKAANANANAKEAESKAVDDLKQSTPLYQVKVNKFKNFEHEKTHIVFNRETELAYGRQQPDGKVTPLTVEDIELCKAHGFPYQQPDKLASKEEKEVEEEEEAEEPEPEDEEEDEDEEDDE